MIAENQMDVMRVNNRWQVYDAAIWNRVVAKRKDLIPFQDGVSPYSALQGESPDSIAKRALDKRVLLEEKELRTPKSQNEADAVSTTQENEDDQTGADSLSSHYLEPVDLHLERDHKLLNEYSAGSSDLLTLKDTERSCSSEFMRMVYKAKFGPSGERLLLEGGYELNGIWRRKVSNFDKSKSSSQKEETIGFRRYIGEYSDFGGHIDYHGPLISLFLQGSGGWRMLRGYVRPDNRDSTFYYMLLDVTKWDSNSFHLLEHECRFSIGEIQNVEELVFVNISKREKIELPPSHRDITCEDGSRLRLPLHVYEGLVRDDKLSDDAFPGTASIWIDLCKAFDDLETHGKILGFEHLKVLCKVKCDHVIVKVARQQVLDTLDENNFIFIEEYARPVLNWALEFQSGDFSLISKAKRCLDLEI